jgi:hypothetical protein
MKKGILGTVILLFAFVFSVPAHAQNAISSGSISGHVTDNTGGAIQGAAVTAMSAETGVQRTAKTNEAGLYNFPSLKVGSYNLTFAQSGFKTTEVRNVVVQVGQATSQDVSLQVGAVSESVTVTAEAPLLRETESGISTVVNQQLIDALPLSGRRYTDFVLLTPNATADGQFGEVSIAGQQGGQDSGYGNGNGSNSFTLDGANATSNYFGDARGRTRVPYVFGEQSIQEFQVADNPYNAAYGGAGTGFVNTVTKSGTDFWHGDAFYYNRNSGVGNANDAIDKANGVSTPLNVLQQFGADLGGPIVRHKTWFYFDYEQQRQLQPISVINSNFSAVTQASFPNAAGQTLPAPNGHFPVPGPFGSPPASDDPNFPIYLQQVSNVLNLIHSNLGERARRRDDLSFFPKVDWQAGNNDHLTFVYNYNRFNSPGGTFTFNPVSFEADESLSNNFVRDHHATIHYTHTFSSTLLNDLHVSFLRDEQLSTPSGLVDPSFPSVGVLASGQFMGFGNQAFARGDTKEFQWEIGEQVQYLAGRHDLRFGFDFNRTHVTDFFNGTFFGNYFFLSPVALALGEYLTYNQSAGNPVFPFTFPYYGFYVQDKFQARPNLTLDLGVREDFQVYPQPKENPAFPLTGQFPNQYKRFSPRIGIAYRPFSKTVVRAGFGVFYEVFNGLNYESSVVSNGLATQQSSTSVFNFSAFTGATPGNQLSPTFPATLPTSGFAASSNISIVDPGFKTPYILESSLEITHELLANTTLTVGTMWSHGVHLISSTAYDRNLIRPTGTTTYILCPAGAGSSPANPVSAAVCTGPTFTALNLDSGLLPEGLLPNVPFGQINALISPGFNQYNSFYLQLQRRVSRGLSVMTAYTFAKNMQGNGADFNNQFDFGDTHGPSLLDQRHRLSIAAVYSPGAVDLGNDVGRRLLSNWTISTVMQFNSGRPYTGLLNTACVGTDFMSACSSKSIDDHPNGDTLNDSAFNQSTGNTALGINGVGSSPGIGYNAFYGPWIDEIDLGVGRDFHLTERHILNFKVQAFNLFNHPNFFVQTGRGINQTQYDPISGVLSGGKPGNCGDGASQNQTCFLVPHPGFKTLQGISELNGPRIFQFALTYRF